MTKCIFAVAVWVALSSIAATPAGAAAPEQIWVAWSDDLGLEDAWNVGASILDRFPDALVLDDPGSARTLRDAGFHLDGPFHLTPGYTVTLVRERSVDGLLRLPTAEWEQSDAHVLWQHSRDAIVEARGPLPMLESDGVLAQQALRARLLRRPSSPPHAFEKPGPQRAQATAFLPVIQDMVQQIQPAPYTSWISNLSGANSILIGGVSRRLSTRSTLTLQCYWGEQYLFEQFQAMGFTDVEYDPYSLPGSNSRNVIATLPGVETPERIYIIGGHLDSISPQPTTLAPGANDNASGVAAVMEIARVLRQYAFRSTIRFIAFTGEEQGLYGSSHYASQAALRGDQIQGVVICDMVAWYRNQYRIDIEGGLPWQPLMLVMDDACTAYTALSTNLVYNSWGSDHVPFQGEGFPAFLAIETEYAQYACYHQTCDTADRNIADFGVEVTRACLATIAHLADPANAATSAAQPSPADRVVLYPSFPNPHTLSTLFRFETPAAGGVEFCIYDARGRLVRTLLHEPVDAGPHTLVWDGRVIGGGQAAAGVYFYRVSGPGGVETRKMSVLR